MATKNIADKAAPPRSPAVRTFVVVHPKRIDGDLMGLKFQDGVCETTDGVKAHASQECGCTVTDKATGNPAWPAEHANG